MFIQTGYIGVALALWCVCVWFVFDKQLSSPQTFFGTRCALRFLTRCKCSSKAAASVSRRRFRHVQNGLGRQHHVEIRALRFEPQLRLKCCTSHFSFAEFRET